MRDASARMDEEPRLLIRLAYGAPTMWHYPVWQILSGHLYAIARRMATSRFERTSRISRPGSMTA
jgi:hypothetical protein